jgi:hypothetical protein
VNRVAASHEREQRFLGDAHCSVGLRAIAIYRNVMITLPLPRSLPPGNPPLPAKGLMNPLPPPAAPRGSATG